MMLATVFFLPVRLIQSPVKLALVIPLLCSSPSFEAQWDELYAVFTEIVCESRWTTLTVDFVMSSEHYVLWTRRATVVLWHCSTSRIGLASIHVHMDITDKYTEFMSPPLSATKMLFHKNGVAIRASWVTAFWHTQFHTAIFPMYFPVSP